MNNGRVVERQPRFVEASINYATKGQIGRSFIDAHDVDSTFEIDVDPHRVQIEDASSNPDFVSDLDREGFALAHHASQVTNFQDEDQVRNVYHEEVRAFLEQTLGVDRVEFAYGDGSYRTSDPAERVTRPSNYPHVDTSERGVHISLATRVPDYQLNGHRWAIYNVWRLLSTEGPLDYPLGIIDAQSMKDDDCVLNQTQYEYEYDGQTLIGETENLLVSYSPEHRWMYFSQMKRHDVVMFKVYDSDSIRNVKVGHVAFRDESCPAEHYRSSFEVRAFVSWSDNV